MKSLQEVFMKIIKMIKVVSLSLIAGGLVTASAYAQNMDVTMDVVKQSDAQNITERVMKRIDLPEAAQNAGMHGNGDQDRARFRTQDRSQGDHDRENRYQMREGARNTMGDSHQMRDDAYESRGDSYQMREDVNDSREKTHQMRNEVNDARDDSYQMREDVNDVQNDVQQMRGGRGMN